jgi:hypothetical protein
LDYKPISADELKVNFGDIVTVELLFDDGFAKAKSGKLLVFNVLDNSGESGILPVICLKPLFQ